MQKNLHFIFRKDFLPVASANVLSATSSGAINTVGLSISFVDNGESSAFPLVNKNLLKEYL